MSVFEFNLIVEGLDVTNVSQLDALFEQTGGDATPVERDAVVLVSFEREAESAEVALCSAVRDVEEAVSSARVVRLDDDLVSTTEIAQRVDRSRESVRLLSGGERGPGDFPAPCAWIGESSRAVRAWRWSDVHTWFQTRLPESVDELRPIDAHTAALFNSVLYERGHDAAGLFKVHLMQRLRGASLLRRPSHQVSVASVNLGKAYEGQGVFGAVHSGDILESV